jgi:acetyl-CoA carboxylase biotin carboxyl carrier protein
MWQEARDLIKRLEGTSIQRLVLEAGNYKIEIERGAPTLVAGPIAAPTAFPTAAPATEAAPAAADNRHPIVSPLVGTFYRAAQPGAKPFVEEGDVVAAGQTVGIVEAMKIMNQVTADRGGRVAQIVAKEAEWVEYQQVLLYLEPVE